MASESPILSSKSKSTSNSKPKSKSKSNSTPLSIHPTTSTSTSTSMSAVATVDKSSSAYLKRREQVRRAQRTHRIRKESYIQTLESSLLTLRTQLRDVQERNEVLEVRLRGHTRLRGYGALCEEMESAGGEMYGNMNMNMDMEAGSASEGVGLGWSWLSEKCEDIGNNASLKMTPPSAGNDVIGEMEGMGSWAMEGGYADLAMEFVLGLEKPCVQRAQALVFSPLNTLPTSLTTKRAELSAYHSFVENGLAQPELRDVSSSLQNLLTLSSAFCLEDEVTPIQAWAQLCGYFACEVIDSKVLGELVDALLVHVRCYGFGAVIERKALEETWGRVMM